MKKIKKNSETVDEKNEESHRRKTIDSCDKKIFMRIQFLLKFYAYRQK